GWPRQTPGWPSAGWAGDPEELLARTGPAAAPRHAAQACRPGMPPRRRTRVLAPRLGTAPCAHRLLWGHSPSALEGGGLAPQPPPAAAAGLPQSGVSSWRAAASGRARAVPGEGHQPAALPCTHPTLGCVWAEQQQDGFAQPAVPGVVAEEHRLLSQST